MQSSFVLITLLFAHANSYVTNFKYTDTTTKLPVDEKNEQVVKKSVVKLDESDSKISNKYIYLEDVVAGLVHQNWTDDEVLCLNQTLDLIRSLQNFTLWAVWQWDSVSSQPMGLLAGNRYQLGNFDQCMRAPWTATHPEVNAQYCLAEVSLEREDHAKKKRLDENEPYGNALDFIQHHTPHVRPLKFLTWGACVPTSCSQRSVERLLSAVLARSHLAAAGLRPRIQASEPCQRSDRPRPYDGLFYGFMALTTSMILICLICTYINIRNIEPRKHNLKYQICKAFCLKENYNDLLKTRKDGLEIIYGIRYITICFITICHMSGMLNSGPISNGIKVDSNILSVLGMFVLHDDIFVDTFFVISAFLLARVIMNYEKPPNIFLFIVKRYIRLTVCLAVVIFYVAAVFPHTGSGPLWDRFVKDESGSCRKNWWLNMLMVQNYFRTDEVCIVISWYIPCDFHYFVVAVVTWAVYRRWRSAGTACACALAVASLLTPGVVNYVYKLAAIQLFTYDFVANPRNNEQFQLTYIKSHTRAAAYIIGFLGGCYFSKMKNKIRCSQTRATIGAWSGVAVMLLVMVSGTAYLWRAYSDLESALYAALNRPVWAAGITLLILSCSFGKVPLLNSFLSWYPWVPLSRLAYGLYLTHTVIIIRNVGIARNSVYYDHFSVFLSGISVIVIGTFCALIIWLVFEAPINNVFVIAVTPRRRNNMQNRVNKPDSETTIDKKYSGNINTGYLQDNLPENLNISSKM